MLEIVKNKETFLFNNFEFTLERKAYRRCLSIYLKEEGPIRVLAPHSVPLDKIQDFILQKSDWIEKTILKYQSEARKRPRRVLKKGQSLPFLGQEMIITPVLTLSAKSFLSAFEQSFLLHIPRNQWSAEYLDKELSEFLPVVRAYYKREAQKYLMQRMVELSKQLGLFPKRVIFKEQKTRWGSCSSSGNINLNWRMIVFSPQIIDSIIIHELCHLQHLNHSKDFWKLVHQFCPQYECLNKELKELQSAIQFLQIK